ncbi:MAG: hypothetical protein ACLUVM_08540 [Blautia faecis]
MPMKGEGLDEIRRVLIRARQQWLPDPSGVGKSSITNSYAGRSADGDRRDQP